MYEVYASFLNGQKLGISIYGNFKLSHHLLRLNIITYFKTNNSTVSSIQNILYCKAYACICVNVDIVLSILLTLVHNECLLFDYYLFIMEGALSGTGNSCSVSQTEIVVLMWENFRLHVFRILFFLDLLLWQHKLLSTHVKNTAVTCGTCMFMKCELCDVWTSRDTNTPKHALNCCSM